MGSIRNRGNRENSTQHSQFLLTHRERIQRWHKIRNYGEVLSQRKVHLWEGVRNFKGQLCVTGFALWYLHEDRGCGMMLHRLYYG
jgi:hypothetical protein